MWWMDGGYSNFNRRQIISIECLRLLKTLICHHPSPPRTHSFLYSLQPVDHPNNLQMVDLDLHSVDHHFSFIYTLCMVDHTCLSPPLTSPPRTHSLVYTMKTDDHPMRKLKVFCLNSKFTFFFFLSIYPKIGWCRQSVYDS